MNSEQIEGNYDKVKGKLKETWGKLTDNDLMLYKGKRDQLVGKLKEQYGIAKEDAEKKLKEIESSCGCSSDSKAA
ncbi:MAG: CsbD family protein [Pseudomonadota bacterium]